MKIQLVQPAVDEDCRDRSMKSIGVYPPLGLLSIATHVRGRIKGVEIEVLDGDIIGQEEVEKKIDGDYVGVSPTILSHKNGLRVAETAKRKNPKSKVVMGGPHATALAREILTNRSYVDAVIMGDGEEAFVDYVHGYATNLVHWEEPHSFFEGRRVVNEPWKNIDLRTLPIPDRSFVDMKKYFKNFQENPPIPGVKRGSVVYSQKGCDWRTSGGGCLFCGRMYGGLRTRKPEQVWQEIQMLKEKYGVDFIWHEADNFSANLDWLREFKNKKPRRLNIASLVFARADQLDEERAGLLSELGVKSVFIGIESGDAGQLRRGYKGTTPEDNLRAVSNLAKQGIGLELSLVLGIPGETEESLENTMYHVYDLSKITKINLLATNVFMPLPGSFAYSMILQHQKLGEKYKGKDDINLGEATRDFIDTFSPQTGYERIQEYARNLTKIFSSLRSGGHGVVRR